MLYSHDLGIINGTCGFKVIPRRVLRLGETITEFFEVSRTTQRFPDEQQNSPKIRREKKRGNPGIFQCTASFISKTSVASGHLPSTKVLKLTLGYHKGLASPCSKSTFRIWFKTNLLMETVIYLVENNLYCTRRIRIHKGNK
ncbi:hypothetical protein A3K29_04915 [Candidatus Collierbacteria bacterium RIFOXYB2_FULL_46_14]|nr:MAG: hypothetical protein A3K29_04915 [Candidatus Collierbacteria bacterium RIFOXYB2_FULL_46_14]OGD76479.1 MAG: hypothetical protein A3K43_04915 [Candidatus Collierbacteria bacterium RIFOXYA2_FULL_46_20]OGD77815.1 MAG: hypothetical protein A3K39_04915 [Candidatus Collierbacteria bacterium RIFOXYC2_FULL_43_15]OGD81105.1 MAG: hypothetical protein A2320_05410 [Pseudomonadales bacterium GWC2_63_15]OGD82537.1 MAG: hypothetical protein A3K36_04915 [Candidatus Collierbacteria bacterium RIFOXYD2_FUL